MSNHLPEKRRFGNYEIIRYLADGNFSVVYEARHTIPQLQNLPITLKVARDARSAQGFLNSARIAAALQHPQIPTLYEASGDSNALYLARKFIDGDDLQNGIRDARFTFTEVAGIVTEAAVALEYAHSLGVIHGYVHPRHLIWGKDESTWLIGFGEFPYPLDMIPGNPLHLAPEQFVNNCVMTPATDTYALCECAIWLLTGRHPFENVGGSKVLAAKQAVLSSSAELLPGKIKWQGLERALRRGLAPNPDDRYQSANEFAAAFRSADPARETRRRFWFWR
jgi:serine/threonine-protein kinase